MEIPEHILTRGLLEADPSCSYNEQNDGQEKPFEEKDEDDDFTPLFNKQDPNIDIKREKVRHRLLAGLIAMGFTQGQAATQLGYTQPWVSQICRQPFFDRLVLKEIARSGRNAVDDLIKNAAPGSVMKLLSLRDDVATPPTVQFNAAKELLNRYLGNTAQTIRHEDVDIPKDPQAAVEQLEKELERRREVN